jgi:hypothetical protein
MSRKEEILRCAQDDKHLRACGYHRISERPQAS